MGTISKVCSGEFPEQRNSEMARRAYLRNGNTRPAPELSAYQEQWAARLLSEGVYSTEIADALSVDVEDVRAWAHLQGLSRVKFGDANSPAVARRRRKLKLLLVANHGGECTSCGYSRCVDALDFHHRDPAEKKFTLTGQGITRSWEKMKAEAEKCVLVCANCHRELHARLRRRDA